MTTGQARLGVEVDQFYRPTTYWIRDRHPSDIYPGGTVSDLVRPVPASEMIHLRLIDRWPQTRGVPWLHTAAKKLNDMDGYSEAEIVAARASAQPIGWESAADAYAPSVEKQEDGTYEQEWQPGVILRPPPGKKLEFYSPNRPNTALDPFMRYMLREVAAGVGVSYEALSRDYSQSNYSSSRLSLLDDRDLWRVLQGWFIRSFRQVVHRMWLQQAVFANAIDAISISEYGTNQEKFEAARFRPRGWGWVDPTKEVSAFKDAVRCGFMTMQEVVSTNSSGSMDYEELVDQREKEVARQDEAGLMFDTDARTKGTETPPSAPEKPVAAKDDSDDDIEDDDKQMRLVK
jgi:lambda family phage portal protein